MARVAFQYHHSVRTGRGCPSKITRYSPAKPLTSIARPGMVLTKFRGLSSCSARSSSRTSPRLPITPRKSTPKSP